MTVQQLYKIPKNNPNVLWFQKPKTQTKLSLNQTIKKTENQQTWSGPTMLTSKKRGGCGGRRRSMNWLDPSDSTKSGKKNIEASRCP